MDQVAFEADIKYAVRECIAFITNNKPSNLTSAHREDWFFLKNGQSHWNWKYKTYPFDLICTNVIGVKDPAFLERYKQHIQRGEGLRTIATRTLNSKEIKAMRKVSQDDRQAYVAARLAAIDREIEKLNAERDKLLRE